jgi:hypothetical protein
MSVLLTFQRLHFVSVNAALASSLFWSSTNGDIETLKIHLIKKVFEPVFLWKFKKKIHLESSAMLRHWNEINV